MSRRVSEETLLSRGTGLGYELLRVHTQAALSVPVRIESVGEIRDCG